MAKPGQFHAKCNYCSKMPLNGCMKKDEAFVSEGFRNWKKHWKSLTSMRSVIVIELQMMKFRFKNKGTILLKVWYLTMKNSKKVTVLSF